MWDHDHAAGRGLMSCRGLYVFSHEARWARPRPRAVPPAGDSACGTACRPAPLRRLRCDAESGHAGRRDAHPAGRGVTLMARTASCWPVRLAVRALASDGPQESRKQVHSGLPASGAYCECQLPI